MFKQSSTSLNLLGILSVIVGIIAFAWPGVTVYALVILFAVYAFLDAGLQAARAFSSRTAGPVAGHLLLGLISLAAGVVALVWPGPTALVLVLVIGIWAVAEDRPGGAAAERPRGLQARVEERVDREQDDQGVHGDAGPGEGDDPDDDAQNAEQVQ